MDARSFLDLFDSASFRGERRRFYAPARLDAHLLGLDQISQVSLRVGERAAVKIEMAAGNGKTLAGGESIESLDTGSIRWLEVSCSL